MSEHPSSPRPAGPASAQPADRPARPAKSSGVVRTVAILAVVATFLVAVVGVMAVVLNKPGPAGADAAAPRPPKGDPIAGKTITQKFGCISCHSDDGTIVRGPSYKGLYASRVTYTDGTTGVIDDAEVREALIRPAAKVIDGFEPLMPPQKNLSETDIENLIAYLWTLRAGAK